MGAWSLVAVIAFVEQDRLPHRWLRVRHPIPIGIWTLIPASVAAILAGLHLLLLDLPWVDLVEGFQLPELPLLNEGTLAAILFVLALGSIALVTSRRLVQHIAIVAGLATATYLIPFQFSAVGIVVLWSAIALLPYVLAQWDEEWRVVYYSLSGGLLAIAALFTISFIASPSRLTVNAESSINHPFIFSGATAALGAIMVNLIVGYRTFRSNNRLATILIVATGALAIYILSIGLVDEFQRQVSDPASATTLQEKASVGLSILWSFIGVGSLIVGISRRVLGLRLFGLGVLAVAILKVFIVDLASVDAERKFFSFIVLGILLLLSSYLYQRLSPQTLGENGS